MFNDIILQERHAELIKLLKSISPDVICLQEVLNEYISLFIDALDEYLPVNRIFEPETRRYGELMFVKKGIQVLNWTFTPLPSNMGRQLLYAQLYTNNTIYNIITFHLESLDSNMLRGMQLAILWEKYGKLSNCICLGDTNLKAGEIPTIPTGFYDISSSVASTTSWGHRYWNNTLQERYDRIWCSRNLVPTQLNILGNAPFAPNKWISDHDGFHVVLTTRQ